MTSADAPGARTASAARTRGAIVEAARRLFLTDGVAATTLARVAAQARITRPGLLKHFSTFDLLLDEVASQFEHRAVAVARAGMGERAQDEESADYAVLSAQLLSVSMTRPPAPATVNAHHRQLLLGGIPALQGAGDTSGLLPADDAQRRRLVAAWEGLHVLSCYFSEISPATTFVARQNAGRTTTPPMERLAAQRVPFQSLLTPQVGYAPGRRRREKIIIDATRVFAQQGFHGTTVRELAAAVGVSASTLLHHVGDKTHLLAEVLRHRDEELVARRDGVALDPIVELAQLGAEARRDQALEPGLIDLYAVLSTEATAPHHPAHAYFKERYARTIAYFEDTMRRASLILDEPVDARLEATWLVALWDGLQYQHVLQPGAIDIPTLLDTHLDALFGDSDALQEARRNVLQTLPDQ